MHARSRDGRGSTSPHCSAVSGSADLLALSRMTRAERRPGALIAVGSVRRLPMPMAMQQNFGAEVADGCVPHARRRNFLRSPSHR